MMHKKIRSDALLKYYDWIDEGSWQSKVVNFFEIIICGIISIAVIGSGLFFVGGVLVFIASMLRELLF